MVESPSSLVQYERRVTTRVLRLSTRPERCPRFPYDWLDVDDGDVHPGSCKSVRCPVCGPREIRRRAWRIARAAPERFITLTQLPPDYHAARRSEASLLRYLRRQGLAMEWAVAHELTKSGQRHAHALQRGDPIPQPLLSRAASRSGMGRIVWISAIRSDGATAYALKEALGVVRYATKGTEELADHLELNGGWLVRTTKGYYRAA